MATLSFVLALDPAETVRASREIQRRARTIRGKLLLMAAVPVPLVLDILFKPSRAVLSAYFAISAAIVLFALLWPSIRKRQLKRFYETTPALNGPQRYVFTDDGLALSNDGATNLIRWSAFVEAAETTEFFLLYYSPKCAYYLPRHVVAKEDQEDALRGFLREKLGEKAKHILAPA